MHPGADPVSDELADDAVAGRGAAIASTAAEMSSMWLPGPAAAMPAIIAEARVVDEVADRLRRLADDEGPGRVAVPAVQIAPASIETTWPSRIVRSPGMPWTISSSIEMQSEAPGSRSSP